MRELLVHLLQIFRLDYDDVRLKLYDLLIVGFLVCSHNRLVTHSWKIGVLDVRTLLNAYYLVLSP